MDGDDTMIVFLGVADKMDNAGDGISAMRDRERERILRITVIFLHKNLTLSLGAANLFPNRN